jgi:hypothetical protein
MNLIEKFKELPTLTKIGVVFGAVVVLGVMLSIGVNVSGTALELNN